jgi:hypothetical protein
VVAVRILFGAAAERARSAPRARGTFLARVRGAMSRSTGLTLIACGAALAAGGCGHGTLIPANSATVVPGAPEAAYSVVDGVRCSADVGAWSEDAKPLPDFVVPVKVRIKNASGRPIQVLYEDFVLAGKNGHSYRPLPIVPLDESDGERPTAIEPIYSSTKFFVGPRLHDVYPTLDMWTADLPRDQALYEKQFRRWGHARLARQAIRMALPEGVLDDGGTISGFLYFESPLAHESRVTFQADFDAATPKPTRDDADSEIVASIEIPFSVE